MLTAFFGFAISRMFAVKAEMPRNDARLFPVKAEMPRNDARKVRTSKNPCHDDQEPWRRDSRTLATS